MFKRLAKFKKKNEKLKIVIHVPVLQKEVIKYLDPKPNENFIDCTIGDGGHSLALLEKNGPKGMVLGIDADQGQIENWKSKIGNLKNRLLLVRNNFANLKEITEKEKFLKVSGILFDLGFSSWHLEKSCKGFTFLKNEPLDMRYDAENPLTAEKILNYWSETEIKKILEEYGEERFAGMIAKEIIETRRVKEIKNTYQLAGIIKKAVPGWYQREKIDASTKTFQALRIAVNDELNNLNKALPQALEVLKPGGKIVVISFHSLEDRIIKNFFKQYAEKEGVSSKALAKEGLLAPYSGAARSSGLSILTKKPIRPAWEEMRLNPRSRSAKLRAAEKI